MRDSDEWLSGDKFYTSYCRCGWRGKQTLTRTAATRQYKLHKRYPKLSKESMAAAAEDLLKTFVMAHTMEMRIDIPEWRSILSVFAEAVKYEEAMRKGPTRYELEVGTRGRGELPFQVTVTFPGYESEQLGNYVFDNWVRRNYHEDMENEFEFDKLINAKNLVTVSKFLLHLDEKHANFKQEYAKWAGWAVEWRESQLAYAKTLLKRADKIAKHKTTWEYLKEKYPTREDAENALAAKTYSKSYTDLLNRLVKYHRKRENER